MRQIATIVLLSVLCSIASLSVPAVPAEGAQPEIAALVPRSDPGWPLDSPCNRTGPWSVRFCWECYTVLLIECEDHPVGPRRGACFTGANTFFEWCLDEIPDNPAGGAAGQANRSGQAIAIWAGDTTIDVPVSMPEGSSLMAGIVLHATQELAILEDRVAGPLPEGLGQDAYVVVLIDHGAQTYEARVLPITRFWYADLDGDFAITSQDAFVAIGRLADGSWDSADFFDFLGDFFAGR